MRPSSVAFLAAVFASACSGDDANTNDDTDQTAEIVLCEPGRAITCEDAVLLDLNLQDTIAPGLIQNTASADGWLSVVDATAGGFNASPPHAYIYGRFTDEGLTKVLVSDETALTTMEWDVAFRRYVARVNSGNSGPSCVTAVALPNGTAFDAVTSAPSPLGAVADEIFDGSCAMIEDGSGLPGSPATALSGFWSYEGCVQMTHRVFVLQLRDGRHVKATFDAYYFENVQSQCDSTGSTGAGSTGSGTLRVRWAFLD